MRTKSSIEDLREARLSVGPIGCRPYHCFFLLLLLLHQSLSRRINIINIFMIWALQSTYYTSPESWGHCLSYRDDNDNDKHTHKDKDKDKDEDKDKDKVLKRPITCYIFEKQGVQGYQIWPGQDRPGQRREESNLADLILELAFLLEMPRSRKRLLLKVLTLREGIRCKINFKLKFSSLLQSVH